MIKQCVFCRSIMREKSFPFHICTELWERLDSDQQNKLLKGKIATLRFIEKEEGYASYPGSDILHKVLPYTEAMVVIDILEKKIQELELLCQRSEAVRQNRITQNNRDAWENPQPKGW